MDYGHKWTDEELRKLEQRISAEYKQAADEMQKKVEKYFADFARKDEIKRKEVSEGKISQSEYTNWRRNQMLVGKRWEEMQTNLAQDMHTVNMKTASMTRQFSYDAYAMNFNYGTFEAESGSGIDTAFTLYDRSTVERLIRDDPDMLPPPGKRVSKRIAEGKDVLWNKQVIQSVMTQSILQGESIPNIATRLAEAVGDTNRKAAIRNARTMTTGAENAGREDSYKRAEKMGIQMEQMWVATLDNRTRHEHRQLDGQKRKVGEPFEVNGQQINFPGDPTAAPHLVYNCRCTLIGIVANSDVEYYKERMDERATIKGYLGMTYKEWKNGHEAKSAKGKPAESEAKPVVEPKADATANTRAAINEAYEYHRKHNNLDLVPVDEISNIDIVMPVNYGNLSDKSVAAISNTLTKLMGEYDTPLNEIRVMTKEEFAFLNGSFASVTHDYSLNSASMLINPVKTKDYNKMIERLRSNIENGYIVDIDDDMLDEYISTHEFAHTLLGMTDKLDNKKNFAHTDFATIKQARKEIQELYDNYLTELQPLQEEFDRLTDEYFTTFDEAIAQQLSDAEDKLKSVKISDYSMENADEFLAEAFTQNRLGKAKSKYSQEVGKTLDKYFKRR